MNLETKDSFASVVAGLEDRLGEVLRALKEAT